MESTYEDLLCVAYTPGQISNVAISTYYFGGELYAKPVEMLGKRTESLDGSGKQASGHLHMLNCKHHSLCIFSISLNLGAKGLLGSLRRDFRVPV